MSKNFHIYKCSAGSGKTYTLALNFIAIAITGNEFGYKNHYRKILAITFTNKAASEMKERVLNYLSTLSQKNDIDNILSWLIKETRMNKQEVFFRSKIIFTHILHNYSDFSISTIDKFTYKIVRTFAIDLGLSKNFDLEIDNNKIIEPVVALILNTISDNRNDLSNTLVDFSFFKLEQSKSANIDLDLQDIVSKLLSNNISSKLDINHISVRSCMNFKNILLKRKKNLFDKIRILAKEVVEFFDINNLQKEHFKSGLYYSHFSVKLFKEDSNWLPSNSLMNNISNDLWYSKSLSECEKLKVDSLKHLLLNFYNKLMNYLCEYFSIKSVLKNIYSIAILNEIISKIDVFKKQNNIEHISEFNNRIHKTLIDQPSSFIYERIGERYSHFLIDEFQDTSLLQWQNILPLVTDSLDFGKSMLVGDSKQSIYRWRGGEVKQFSELPNIYSASHLSGQNDWQKKISSHFINYELKENYRSRKEIIKFNNLFYEKVKNLLSNDLIKIYDNVSQKSSYSKDGGFVHIELFDRKKENFKNLILKKMLSEIKKITSSNQYLYSDISILCNTKRSVSIVAEYFAENDIPVISNEGLLLKNSPSVNLIVSVLKFLQNNDDRISKLSIAHFVYINFLNEDDLTLIHDEIKSLDGFVSFLNRAQINLNSENILKNSFYDLIESIIYIFRVEENIYTDFFLDLVLQYIQKNSPNIAGFLSWWDDRCYKEAISIPHGINALQVMTIHKSKGLAFKVVFIPFNWEDKIKKSEIWVDSSNKFKNLLPVALLGYNNDLEYTYFKDQYLNEKNLRLLDELNKLYVATTRAKDRLYIFSKEMPKNLNNYERKMNLNSFLYYFGLSYPMFFGDPNTSNIISKNTKNVFKVDKRKKLNWKEIISLKHSASDVWDIKQMDVKRDWGKLLHFVLSKIYLKNDAKKTINQLYKLGSFTQLEHSKLSSTINQIVNHKKLINYFSDLWIIKNEKEILLTNGKTYIPDRLLISKDYSEVVILDYKTGKPSNEHNKQIHNYAETLICMGYNRINKILVYISKNVKVIEL